MLTTVTNAENRRCATCQFWQGEREVHFVTRTMVQVRYGRMAHCTAWRQDRPGTNICNRYKRWVELP